MTRPTPSISAFDCCGELLTACPWPANPLDGLTAIHEQAQSNGRDGNPAVEFEKSVGPRFEQLHHLLQAQAQAQALSGTLSQASVTGAFAPSVMNVHRPPPDRYFRALVWNLENFTHDNRPAGTVAIRSRRNQARIAIVADAAFRLGIDALLIMETGSDVGQAMTLLAQRWQHKETEAKDPVVRSVEPLVSPATHAMPEIPTKVAPAQYAPQADNVRALALLGEGYRVSPASFRPLDANGLRGAFDLLYQTSNNVQELAVFPPLSDDLTGSLAAWARWAHMGFDHGDFSWADPNHIYFLRRVLHDAGTMPDQFLSQPETELGEVREAILMARAMAAEADAPSLEAGVAEMVQMLLLAWILEKNLAPSLSQSSPSVQSGPQVSQQLLWLNGYSEPADLVVLALLMGSGHAVGLEAHDTVNGPVFSCSDGELLLNGLIRLGILSRPHAETYGVAYRPHTPAHLEKFFDGKFEELGFNTGGIYGILHGDSTRMLKAQTAGGVLNGRSALKISFPLAPDLYVPFAIHHNRYSGSKDIKEMESEFKVENTMLARLLTIEDEVKMLAGQTNPALLVGDFNLTAPFVQAGADKKGSWQKTRERRAKLRDKHVRQVGAAGYLRRRCGDATHPQTTLKRALNIAKGKEIFSEPYDAVYQPFDFLQGRAQVRSAAVRDCRAFFTDALMPEPITAATPDGEETLAIGVVVHEQIMRTYAGIIWCIASTLKEAEPWLAEEAGKASAPFGHHVGNLQACREEFVKWLWSRRNEFDRLLGIRLLDACPIVSQQDWFGFMKGIIDGVTPHIKDVVKAQAKAKAQARKKAKEAEAASKMQDVTTIDSGANVNADTPTDSDDLLSDAFENDEGEDEEAEDARKSDAGKAVKKKRAAKAAHLRLMELGDLFDALVNLENRPDLRLWGAYGSIVSDHLPVLVEVDFGPRGV